VRKKSKLFSQKPPCLKATKKKHTWAAYCTVKAPKTSRNWQTIAKKHLEPALIFIENHFLKYFLNR